MLFSFVLHEGGSGVVVYFKWVYVGVLNRAMLVRTLIGCLGACSLK